METNEPDVVKNENEDKIERASNLSESGNVNNEGEEKPEIDKKDPLYIPRKGKFYEHDDRLDEDEAAIEK